MPVKNEDIKHSFFDHSPVGKLILSTDKSIIACNPSFENQFGFKKEELIGKKIDFLTLKDTDQDAKFQQLIDGTLEQYVSEQKFNTKTNDIIWAIMNVFSGKRDHNGQIDIINIAFQDITKIKKLEADLINQEMLLNQVGQIARIGGWERDLVTGKSSWTKGIYEIFGLTYDLDFPNSEKKMDFFDPIDQKMISAAVENLIRTGKDLDLIAQIKNLNNQHFHIRIHGKAVFEGNKAVKIRGIVQDITQQVKSKKQLIESEKKHRFIFENTRDMISLHDPDGTFLDVSPSCNHIVGYKPEELLGNNAYQFFHKQDIEKVRIESHDRIIKVESVQRVQYRFRHKDGHYVWLDSFTESIADNTGEIFRLVCSSRDITESKLHESKIMQLNDTLQRSNKELMEFAYVASHDLQEPLRMISSFVNLLGRKYVDSLDDQAKKYINYAEDGALRMQTMINDLLSYSRINNENIKRQEINLLDIIERIKMNLATKIGQAKVEIAISDLPEVFGVPSQIERLFQNLIDNAIKYSDKDKESKIVISHRSFDKHFEFKISDNGIGIDPAFFEKIFVIFQRLHTRDEYSGTGIGLSICARIVSQHQGKIWVKSTPGIGSDFYFTLSKKKSYESH